MSQVIDINERKIEAFIELLRPKDSEIRKQLDYGYNHKNKTFELFEIRPVWNNPNEVNQSPFAKIKYDSAKSIWKLYWMRASLKWNLYEPFSSSPKLQELLLIIKEDAYGCFFG
jgi:hypothetical protein